MFLLRQEKLINCLAVKQEVIETGSEDPGMMMVAFADCVIWPIAKSRSQVSITKRITAGARIASSAILL